MVNGHCLCDLFVGNPEAKLERGGFSWLLSRGRRRDGVSRGSRFVVVAAVAVFEKR